MSYTCICSATAVTSGSYYMKCKMRCFLVLFKLFVEIIGVALFRMWLQLTLCHSPNACDKNLKVLLLLFGLLATEWYQKCFKKSDDQSLCN